MSRSILGACLIGWALVLPARAADVAVDAAPVAVVQGFYDGLVDVMKRGKDLGFKGRYAALEPLVRRMYDLGVMAKVAVGSAWSGFTPEQRTLVTDAFARYTIATYASRFAGYDGEAFIVAPATRPVEQDMIVDTKLAPKGEDPIELDYRMRKGDSWRAVDVYLTGTISQLATQRSDFGSVIRHGGAEALARELDRKSDGMAAE